MSEDREKRKPRCYIVQDNPQHAFWPAERFGELQHCLPPRADFNVDTMVPRLRAALREFDADNDYLLLSGAPLSCGVAFALVHERYDQFTVLRWSSQAQDYVVESIDMLSTKSGDNDEPNLIRT
jgi:hypothetical protein